MPAFSHTVLVDAPRADLWALVRDVARVAALFPYTRVDSLDAPEPGCWLFWRHLAIPNVADLRWREQARVSIEGELRFQAVEGDLETFAGSWLVAAQGEQSRLTLQVEYAIPETLAPRMPAAMVHYVMGEIFKSICKGVKEAAEGAVA